MLLAILSAHKVTVDHNRVAQIVGCTPRACEERIKKLRKLAKECGYEVQSPTPSLSGKKVRKGGKGGKGGGKGKCMDNEDMILYKKGIVSDDTEVKMEDGMRIKREMIKREFGFGGYHGYGYGYGEDVKPFIKQQKMEGSPFLFAANTGIGDFDTSYTPYANTVTGFGIPLGVPLEVSCEPLMPSCRRGKEKSDFNSGAIPLKKEFPRPQKYYHHTPKKRSPKIEHPVHTQEPAEFVEISPASKKDPIVINDDDRDGICDVHKRVASEVECGGTSYCVL